MSKEQHSQLRLIVPTGVPPSIFFFPLRGRWKPLTSLLQMGTMRDTKRNRLDDFTVKDAEGRVIREPSVPMLIEELKVSYIPLTLVSPLRARLATLRVL